MPYCPCVKFVATWEGPRMSRSCRGSRLALGTDGTFSMNFSFGLSGSVMPAGRGNAGITGGVGWGGGERAAPQGPPPSDTGTHLPL